MGRKPKSKLRNQDYVCEYCKKQCDTKERLVQHRIVHLHRSRFKCTLCDYVANYKHHLKQHMGKHITEKPFKCQHPNCNASFMDSYGLSRHQLVHKKDDDTVPRFKCPKCPYETVYKAQIRDHQRTHSSVKEFSCDLCLYRTKYKNLVQKHHERVHLKLKPFKCQKPNCNYTTSQKSHLIRHQIIHTEKTEKPGSLRPFKCPKCDHKTTDMNKLKLHLKVHTKVKPFACGLCPFRSRHESCVKVHQEALHPEDSSVRPFKCPVLDCNYSGKTKGGYLAHKKVHENDRPYVCSVPDCDFKTKWSRVLKDHEIWHRDERPYKCSLCSFASNHRSCLLIHKRRHTGECPFPCPKCPYRAKTSSTLKDHVSRQHSGKKPRPKLASIPCRVRDCTFIAKGESSLASHFNAAHHLPVVSLTMTNLNVSV